MRPESIRSLETCDWHTTVRVDTRNELLAGPTCDEKHVREKVVTSLPPAYTQWQAATRHAAPPTEYSPHCPKSTGSMSRPSVTFPRNDERFALDPGLSAESQRIQLRADVTSSVREVTWFVDGQEIGKARWPYALTWQLSPGPHTVEVDVSGKRSKGVSFLVL